MSQNNDVNKDLCRCLVCGQIVKLVFVHSHYQCPACGNNVLPCCEGENNDCDEEEKDLKNTKSGDKIKKR